ncbi:hypothetical protein QTJ16_001595 [Diplocarpon rosae]|uniref:Uncharacterized protein n=1 Tax=Diplocarpon rosae TaxID=946125 RepID=A0AAD9T4E7_9HELO|nr:hypothetical protein QTJ16_001595 [Diplocarpon rosae]PBP15632.1 hypothetical protein BUE80_DR013640 [Diplocarpon rosae]
MAPSLYNIVARSGSILRRDDDDDDDNSMSDTMIDLLIALMVLVFVALCLLGALVGVRKVRRSRAVARQQLPTYHEPTSGNRPLSNHRRLTVTAAPYDRVTRVSVHDDEKSAMMSPTTPTSPVPEIRITFPDVHDASGRPKSGGVVIVRVGENGVGLEPVSDEQLPAYEKESGEKFHSIDIDRIGGLKETHPKDQYS